MVTGKKQENRPGIWIKTLPVVETEVYSNLNFKGIEGVS